MRLKLTSNIILHKIHYVTAYISITYYIFLRLEKSAIPVTKRAFRFFNFFIKTNSKLPAFLIVKFSKYHQMVSTRIPFTLRPRINISEGCICKLAQFPLRISHFSKSIYECLSFRFFRFFHNW